MNNFTQASQENSYDNDDHCPSGLSINHVFHYFACVSMKVFNSQNDALEILISITGWTYVISWIISSYPQLIVNHRLRSVAGLSLNFLLLNIAGHLSYSIYNVCFYFVPIVGEAYQKKHPNSTLPVYLNDVGFAVHSLIINLLIGLQCLIFERGDQTVNIVVLIFLCSLGLCAIFLGILTCLNSFQLLSFVDFFGSIKIIITVIKCTPQVYYNYCRQSTIGWSILAVNLDMVGSILSIVQMALAAFKDDDWSSLVGNFGKLGLGLVSMFFNLIFMVQHYLLYPGSNPVRSPSISSIQTDFDDPEKQKLSHKSDDNNNNNNNNETPNSHDES